MRNRMAEVIHPDAEMIEDYVMGVRLAPSTRYALAAHFLHCRTCRKIYAEERAVVETIRATFRFNAGRVPLSRN